VVTSHEVTTYFDTLDRALLHAGATLRVRRRGNQRVQTVKLRDAADPFARGEWEWPVKTDQPELSRLAETPLARIDTSVQPVFVTDVQRDVRDVHQDDATIEVAMDRGQIRAGDAVEDVCELELELKQGDAAGLYRLAIGLHADAPMSLGAESKADRGWRLRSGHARPAEKHTDVALPADVSAGDAFRRILDNALGHLMANQPAAASGDVEGVHQMRIAIRRARAALLLFKPQLEPHALAQFTDALRHLGRVFGEARDWDVFCTEMLSAAEAAGANRSWLDLLRAPAEALRRDAHRRVAAELSAPLLTATVLGLQAWQAASDKALADLVPDLLGRLEQKVLHRSRHIAELDNDGLHRLRKALKKLRYGIEFVAPLLDKKATKRYLHRCKALLKQLGALNDAVVAVSLAEQLADERKPELAPAVSALAERTASQQRKARRHIERDWARLRDEPLPD
jgi:triphosphatase